MTRFMAQLDKVGEKLEYIEASLRALCSVMFWLALTAGIIAFIAAVLYTANAS